VSELPTGTVTFLFSDIEGSTRLVERLGTAEWTQVLSAHQRIIRAAIAEGAEVKTEGDSFFVVFRQPASAVGAAVAIQRGLAVEAWPEGVEVRVRIGIHTGEGVLAPTSDYVGLDVHRAARIAAAAHGGQTLLSGATAALLGSNLEDGVEVRDRGEHRLKDLSRPERLAELLVAGLPADFPPLRTLDAAPNNLPTQLTTFLGREREIEAILGLLRTNRLLTLTGPGGTGKTRLSLEVAGRSVEDYPDGVFFVPLDAITQADFVGPTIASHVGLPDRGGSDAVARLVEHLAERRVLVVLDNFEQVVDAAPVVGQLLAGVAGLSILVTSRALLHLYGEREFPVPPLGVPDPRRLPELAEVSEFEAVRLFVERAMAVRPAFRLDPENSAAVAGICHRLDGLPLAIELAAARVRILPPQSILDRLQGALDMAGGGRDLPERQRTLRGAIAWSHDLLGDPERDLFAGLSVFVGGASLDAIETVVGDAAGDVVEGLGALADVSLVRAVDDIDGAPRFAMLETIREFAAERLAERGRTAKLRASHADLFCSLVDRARPTIMGSDKRRTLDRLEQEHGNLRAAFDWSVESGDTARALRMPAGLWRFWQMRGYLAEGYERVSRALAMPRVAEHPDLLADAHEAAGGLRYWQGRLLEARAHYEEALSLRRSLGDVAGEAEQLYNLSFTYAFGDEPDAAASLRLTERALEGFRAVGDQHGVAKALWALANGEVSNGQPAASKRHALEALPLFEAADDRFMVAWSEYLTAVNQIVLSEPIDEVEQRLQRALALFVEAGDVSGYVLVMDTLSYTAQVSGDMDRAARIAGGVVALEMSSGTGLNPVNRLIVGYDPKALRALPGWQVGHRMPLADLIRYALREPVTA
jgi:predicted ATPase/class 3 adenylate cyclase